MNAAKILRTALLYATLSAVICLELGCAPGLLLPSEPMPPVNYFENMETTAGAGESEIVVKRVETWAGGANKIKIFIDDEERLSLNNGKSGTVIVPDGEYSIYAKLWITKSSTITFEAARSRIVIEVKGDQHETVILSKYAVIPLDAHKSKATNAPIGLEEAIKKASSIFINKLPVGSKIAVVNVESDDRNDARLVIDGIAFHLVSSERFTIVDRNTLDVIRNEQRFQMSGAVSDADIVQIGELSGANVVIAGSVTKSETSNRLSLKALDVKTGQIIAMARGSY